MNGVMDDRMEKYNAVMNEMKKNGVERWVIG